VEPQYNEWPIYWTGYRTKLALAILPCHPSSLVEGLSKIRKKQVGWPVFFIFPSSAIRVQGILLGDVLAVWEY